MNHGFYNFVGVAIIFLLVCSGCRGIRVSSRNQTKTSRTERVERSVESTRSTELEEQRAEHRGSEAERVFTRTTEYDSTGSIQRVSETWRDRRLSNVSAEERTTRVVSIDSTETNIVTHDTTSVIVQEKTSIENDSRPIQGFEWVWVILTLTLLISVAIYILVNRFK